MKTSGQAARVVCWASTSLGDPDVLVIYAIMLAVLACGGVAIWFACRWYRNLKQPPSITGEALAQLDRALEEQDELEPEEVARIREAIEKQRKEKA